MAMSSAISRQAYWLIDQSLVSVARTVAHEGVMERRLAAILGAHVVDHAKHASIVLAPIVMLLHQRTPQLERHFELGDT
jgi:hypothetical protein